MILINDLIIVNVAEVKIGSAAPNRSGGAEVGMAQARAMVLKGVVPAEIGPCGTDVSQATSKLTFPESPYSSAPSNNP